MKRKTILTLTAAAVIGAIAIPAIAGSWGPNSGCGPQRMMGMMHGAQSDMIPAHRGPGMVMPGGHGFLGMGVATNNPIYQSFDVDEDGTVTSAELQTGIGLLHAEHDVDGNGALSSGEFENLFAKATRGFAERPFTMLDADADGEISAEEMAFPAQMMARMQRLHAPVHVNQQ